MEIKYRSREESKAEQEQRFMALSPLVRFYAFLKLMEQMKDVPTKAKPEKKGNFVIEINSEES